MHRRAREAIRVVRELENSRASILAQMQAFAKSIPEYSLIREMACVEIRLHRLLLQRSVTLETSTPSMF